jgi:hypothetical protein
VGQLSSLALLVLVLVAALACTDQSFQRGISLEVIWMGGLGMRDEIEATPGDFDVQVCWKSELFSTTLHREDVTRP